jgi:hypothetical protein
MSDLETIRFQKLPTLKFTEQDKLDLLSEFKKRKITCRVTATHILFDERYLKLVKDIVPASIR